MLGGQGRRALARRLAGLVHAAAFASTCALLTVTLACSFSMQTVSKDWSEQQTPACDHDSGKPGIDAVVAVLGGVIGAAMLLNLEDCDEGSSGGPCGVGNAVAGGLAITSLAVGALYASSAVYGFSKQRTCRRAKAAHLAWRRARAKPATRRPSTETGARGGSCYPNQSCHHGLVCAAGQCVPGPTRGHLGGSCFRNATCFAPLVCADDRCANAPAEATASTTPSDGATSSKPIAAAPRPSPGDAERGRAGGVGGRCFANGSCLDGFHCIPETNRCGEGAIGTAGAICYANDTCDAGLVCDTAAWRCVTPPPSAEGAE